MLSLYREFPLGYVLTARIADTQKNVLFCHGGAPVVNALTTSDVKELANKYEFGPIEQQLLWNDPQKEDRIDLSRRGTGYWYGESAFAGFC